MEKIIIVDASGSMAEEGKKSVVRYLIYAIKGIMEDCYPDMEYRIVLWNEKISDYGKKVDFCGSTDAAVLSDFLDRHQRASILLLGDGSYSDDVKRVIRSADQNIMSLMVGSDCNRSRLQKILGTERIYESADVSTCVDDFVYGVGAGVYDT